MFQLSAAGQSFVRKELARYEDKKSAIIPSLYCVQNENGGWVSPESIDYLSRLMDLPVSQIQEVFSFYSMFNKKPVGKCHIQICCTLSCAMADARELADYVEKKLGVKTGEVTSDGQFSVSRVECLGSCGTAPVASFNDDYYESLSPEKIDKLLVDFRSTSSGGSLKGTERK